MLARRATVLIVSAVDLSDGGGCLVGCGEAVNADTVRDARVGAGGDDRRVSDRLRTGAQEFVHELGLDLVGDQLVVDEGPGPVPDLAILVGERQHLAVPSSVRPLYCFTVQTGKAWSRGGSEAQEPRSSNGRSISSPRSGGRPRHDQRVDGHATGGARDQRVDVQGVDD